MVKLKNRVNRFIWKMPSWVHDAICYLTGWRLVEIKEITNFKMSHMSLDRNGTSIGGWAKYNIVLEWHKEYPIK